MALAAYLLFFLISHQLLLSLSDQDPNPRCQRFHCGNLGNIGFPFSNRTHPECGLFVVDNCNEQEVQKIQLLKKESSFYVKEISQDNTLGLYDQLDPNPSCKSFRNLTLIHSPFISFNITYKQHLFKCPNTHYSMPKSYSLLSNFSTHSVIYDNRSNNSLPSPPAQCSVIQQQVTNTEKNVVFNNIYTSGFGFFLQVNVTRECYECHWRGGQCQSDSKGNFNCSKAEPDTKITEPGSDQGRSIIKVAVAATASGVGILIIILVFCFRKEISFDDSMPLWRKKTKNHQNC